MNSLRLVVELCPVNVSLALTDTLPDCVLDSVSVTLTVAVLDADTDADDKL